jgi:REP element-mobilizing transposase RayT
MKGIGNRKQARRSIRLKGYDYRLAGGYFVTICIMESLCLLGDIVQGKLELTYLGRIVDEEWQKISKIREHVELDVYIVMPNHFHGIVWLTNEPELMERHASTDIPVTGGELARQALPLPTIGLEPIPLRGPHAKSLGAVIGGFKSATTRRVNKEKGVTGKSFWQRNYWERIIRNKRELQAIRRYVWNNPAHWQKNDLHPRRAR